MKRVLSECLIFVAAAALQLLGGRSVCILPFQLQELTPYAGISCQEQSLNESSKNSVVSGDVSLLLAQLLQHVRCACRRVWGQEPSAALPGVSATQGLHNAAGLADRP